MVLGRKIAQPLTALGKATDEIGKGDFGIEPLNLLIMKRVTRVSHGMLSVIVR